MYIPHYADLVEKEGMVLPRVLWGVVGITKGGVYVS